MSLKYDNFRIYWAVVTEKKTLNSFMQRYKSAFSPVINRFEKCD